MNNLSLRAKRSNLWRNRLPRSFHSLAMTRFTIYDFFKPYYRLSIFSCFRIFVFSLLLLPVISSAQSKKHFRYLSRWDNENLKHIGDQTFNDLWGWAAPNGQEYAIIGSVDSIYFIEVTNPNNPQVRAVAAGKFNNCIHRDFQTYSHYAYCVADEGMSSLQIFDLQYLPDSVHKVYDSDTLVRRAHDIFIEKDLIYFAHPATTKGNTEYAHALIVASLKNPIAPALINTIDANNYFEYAHDIFVRNDTAFLNCGADALWIYDFTDPTKPQLISSIENYTDQGFNHSSAVSPDGKFLYFTDETRGMRIKKFDINTLRSPIAKDRKPEFLDVFGSHSSEGSIAHNPYVLGEILICSYYEDGVVAFDVKTDSIIDSYDTYPNNANGIYSGFHGCWGVYPYLPSGTILVSDISNGLFCLKLDTLTGINNTQNPLSGKSFYPNPFSDYITFSCRSSDFINSKLEFNSVTGKCVLSMTLNINAGSNHIYINTLSLPSGIYFLRIKTEDGVLFRTRVVKM